MTLSNMNETRRYVIRRKNEKDYYNGHNTYGGDWIVFGEFNKAKVFKNIGGAKVACGDLWLHQHKELEIVEIVTTTTDNVVEYKFGR